MSEFINPRLAAVLNRARVARGQAPLTDNVEPDETPRPTQWMSPTMAEPPEPEIVADPAPERRIPFRTPEAE